MSRGESNHLAEETIVVLTFRVGRFSCAFPVDRVSEIVAIAATTKVPGQPSILEGFLNLRGAVVPVVRTAALFGESFQAGQNSPIIITRGSTGPLGFLVDEVHDVFTVHAQELRPLTPGHIANECAQMEFHAGGKDEKVAVIDCDRLLLVEEARRIDELEAQAKSRLAGIEAAGP